ncbi:MAG: lysophospholipase [Myxococcota bacterium]
MVRSARWLGVGWLAVTGCGAKRACLDAAATAETAPSITAADGTCLACYRWRPEGEPRGIVVVVHGIRDHATRYDALARALVDRGLVVVAHDLRGHGSSGGHRQRFDSLDQLLTDLDGVVDAARAADPGLPVFVYGHSLGGLITTEYALAHPTELAGIVLSGAALKLSPDVTGGQIAGAKLFGTILPNLPAQPVDDTVFVSTPEATAAFLADPQIDHAKLPARSAKAALNGLADVSVRYGEVTVPMLVMHGGADVVTPIDGSRALVAASPSADKTLKIWDGQFHDLLHEPAAAEVITLAADWIAQRTAPE